MCVVRSLEPHRLGMFDLQSFACDGLPASQGSQVSSLPYPRKSWLGTWQLPTHRWPGVGHAWADWHVVGTCCNKTAFEANARRASV